MVKTMNTNSISNQQNNNECTNFFRFVLIDEIKFFTIPLVKGRETH